ANIFTLYHKLNQIANFASTKSKSPKSDLLFHHLGMIKENGKKVLILSQYEKLGIKKIDELLNNEGIKHIIAPNALSVEDMQKAISMFQSQSDIVAFVSDAKISRLKFSNFVVPYLIKFDQWWNPISNWELEDLFVKDGDESLKEIINICNYYSSESLDQRIRELLLETDLLNKNIFELMQPKIYEELVLVDEWLRVFGMPVTSESKNEQTPEVVQNVLKKITIDTFRKILSKLFSVLGYSEVDIFELPNSNSFNMVGKSQRNNRAFFLNARVFVESKIDKKTIENILSETSKSNHDKIFIITRESFPEISIDKLRENVTMLDGLALSKLLIRVGILPTPP
ncbi:MAG TPA: restriction endonuclease, partial [Ignavibacteriaceae bacterium]